MIMFRTSSVFMCCFFLLLTTLPKSHSQPPPLPPPLSYLSVCKEQSYNCGKLTDILYPFWGQNRPPQCGGGPPFKLNCGGDDTTTIQIGSQNFRVTNIDMYNKIMRLVRTDLANINVCSLQSEDIYINSALFGYLPSVYNITIFYDCPQIKDFPSGHNLSCGHPYSYFGVKNHEQFKKFWNQLESCKQRLDVPSNAESGPDNAANGDRALTGLLNEGFEVKYDVPEDCEKCLGSEGDCRSDGVDSCYFCPDGSHDCYHQKSMSSFLSLSPIVLGSGHALLSFTQIYFDARNDNHLSALCISVPIRNPPIQQIIYQKLAHKN